MTFTLGLVQPQGYRGNDEHRNVGRALEYMDEASALGVDMLCFPEGYPGPFSGPRDYNPSEAMRSKAAAEGICTIYGALEETAEGVYTTQFLVDGDGNEIGKYRRTMPAAPGFYTEILDIETDDLAWGDRVPVFETEHCTVGIVVCSELFATELPRVLALKGADVILNPSGWITWTLRESWRSLVRARAIENLVYTGTCSQRYGREKLAGRISAPESVIEDEDEDGILTAEVDLERLAWLRNNEETGNREEYEIIPGRSSGLSFNERDGVEFSRRPELYQPITAGREDDFDATLENGH